LEIQNKTYDAQNIEDGMRTKHTQNQMIDNFKTFISPMQFLGFKGTVCRLKSIVYNPQILGSLKQIVEFKKLTAIVNMEITPLENRPYLSICGFIWKMT
jgi:hypothetical protein